MQMLTKREWCAIKSDKVDFQTRNITRDEEKHFIMIRVNSLQRCSILNLYVLININFKMQKAKLIELKGEINRSKIIKE